MKEGYFYSTHDRLFCLINNNFKLYIYIYIRMLVLFRLSFREVVFNNERMVLLQHLLKKRFISPNNPP